MSSLDFVQSLLSSSCRHEALNSVLKLKLRGKKLLLERVATTSLDSSQHQSRKGKKSQSCLCKRAAKRGTRRSLLVETAKSVTWEHMQQQHLAWNEYAQTALLSVPGKDTCERALHLDWHGAQLYVRRSAGESLAAAQGLVVAETRRMLLLANGERHLWVPKQGTVVELVLPGGNAVQCETNRRL